MSAEDTRVCTKCSQEKPVSDFYRSNKVSCKECLAAAQRAKSQKEKQAQRKAGKREEKKAQENLPPSPIRITRARVCNNCGQRKPVTAFCNSNLTCKECTNIAAREKRKAKREKEKADYLEMLFSMPFHERVAFLDRRRRDRHYRQNYGMSLARFDAMYREQEGKCAICREERNSVELYVDHDHSLGLVRGLLCQTCNAGIGMLKDSPEVLFNAAKYLSKFHNGLEGWIS